MFITLKIILILFSTVFQGVGDVIVTSSPQASPGPIVRSLIFFGNLLLYFMQNQNNETFFSDCYNVLFLGDESTVSPPPYSVTSMYFLFI
jgi:hypothetical protein